MWGISIFAAFHPIGYAIEIVTVSSMPFHAVVVFGLGYDP